MTLHRSGALALLLAALAGCAEPPVAAPPPSVAASAPSASRHMVAAAHPLAVEAGLAMLRRGGSAVDAAIATQMVLGVVEPHASGLGGGGFLMLLDPATARVVAWDGRETAPAGATPELFLQANGEPLPFRDAVASGLSVGVPGVLRMLETVHRERGRLPWADLFQPAIQLARGGFEVAPRLATRLEAFRSLGDEPGARALYWRPDGTPKRAGDRVVNVELADLMQRIAREGSSAFYEGAVAAEMVARVRGHRRPGTLSLDDLRAYRPIRREALCGPYRAWTICGMPPPSSGGIAVAQMLAILEPHDLGQLAPSSAAAAHLIAEAGRLAFADRDRYVADPAHVDVPTAGLLARDYLARRAALVRTDRSMGKAEPGQPSRSSAFASDETRTGDGTSHITVVDGRGEAVSFTTTIEAPFGSQIQVRGMLLNNELTDFSLRPEIARRPVANQADAGKRPRSSMSPTIVLDRDRRFHAALGSAGSARIIGDTLHTLVGILDWNLSMQAAIDRPRVINMNGVTELEEASGAEPLAATLRAMGHEAAVRRHEGGLSGIQRRAGAWDGGADRRRDGVARGE